MGQKWGLGLGGSYGDFRGSGAVVPHDHPKEETAIFFGVELRDWLVVFSKFLLIYVLCFDPPNSPQIKSPKFPSNKIMF